MSQEPENKMLFDLRGRRKRFIQIIYVILAILMAGSLVVIGLPGGSLLGGGGGAVSQDAADLAVERAVRLQNKIKAEPNNENARIELIRARITAGSSLVQIDEDTGEQTIGPEATTQYDLAAQEWDRYLKKSGGNPDASVAQLVANTLFSLAQGSTVSQFQQNIKDAARAQQYFTDSAVKESKKDGPSATGPLTTLATYQFYAQDFDAAEASLKKALASTPGAAERKQIEQQIDAVRKDAKRIGKVIAQAKKQAKQTGANDLENPVGNLGSGGALGGTPQP